MWLLLLAGFVASALLTGLIRRLAIANQLMDIPNSRSAHQVPTPRGGGLAFVLLFLVILSIYVLMDLIESSVMGTLIMPALMVALVGFLDDRFNLKPKLRLIVQVVAACFMVWSLNHLPAIFGEYSGGVYLVQMAFAAVLFIVWMINLYNFMDGIDGFAATQAITVCIIGGVCGWFQGIAPLAPFLLAALTGGFLVWNAPPAKIFMGDVGSGFLGCVIASFALIDGSTDANMFWVWIIASGSFIIDATLTLFIRALRKEPIFQAHSTHAYQHATRKYKSHKYVTIALAIINLCWLFPWAYLTSYGFIAGFLATVITYVPLAGLWLVFRHN